MASRPEIVTLLQWGHAFVSVETAEAQALYTPWRVLQWGHAFVSVETSRRGRPSRRNRRFSGATLL